MKHHCPEKFRAFLFLMKRFPASGANWHRIQCQFASRAKKRKNPSAEILSYGFKLLSGDP